MRRQWVTTPRVPIGTLFDSVHLRYPTVFLAGLLILAGDGLAIIAFGVSPFTAIPMLIAGICMLAATRVVHHGTLALPHTTLPIFRPSARDGIVLIATLGVMLGTAVSLMSESTYAANVSISEFVVISLVMFFAVAPIEEIVFRHIVQRKILWGQWVIRVFGAAVLFGGAHIRVLLGTPDMMAFGVIIGLGVVLGASYEATGNLLVPIAAHGAYNTFIFGVPLLF